MFVIGNYKWKNFGFGLDFKNRSVHNKSRYKYPDKYSKEYMVKTYKSVSQIIIKLFNQRSILPSCVIVCNYLDLDAQFLLFQSQSFCFAWWPSQKRKRKLFNLTSSFLRFLHAYGFNFQNGFEILFQKDALNHQLLLL